MAIKDDPLILEYSFRLNGRREQVIEYISLGKCKDYADYKKHVGILKGISMSGEIMDYVIKNHGKESDDIDEE